MPLQLHNILKTFLLSLSTKIGKNLRQFRNHFSALIQIFLKKCQSNFGMHMASPNMTLWTSKEDGSSLVKRGTTNLKLTTHMVREKIPFVTNIVFESSLLDLQNNQPKKNKSFLICFFETGPPDKDDEEFTKFVSKHKTPDESLPEARRSITPDHAQHLALTYNMWMYRSTLQKRAQLEDAIYWGYVGALKDLATQCMHREQQGQYRFCKNIFREFFDALAPITNVKYIWDFEELEEIKKKRLEMYTKWATAKQEIWDKHGMDAVAHDI
ncbi:hypothetical protein RFI_02728 [Reticulomyxa filosa]|uniref:Uncharacterized protein n=1 Tax=Reticulomyxa filosa TaxID=46433 RepID=X6P880_RETFI|nr:hypothetical protein RFI_02728 [Reticulomyxa filosa]|eukprot:ETO34366.1 hypothetical protein RFI_02728 [Reticulomyxa filosa]